MRLCKKATEELTNTEHPLKNKQNAALLQVHAAETQRNTNLRSVSEALSAQEREALIANESRNRGPGHTSCFRGKRKGCPSQAKDMTILQTD